MINWHSQAADQLILEKLLIMRPSANIAIFRLGISLLTALPMACFYANKAISHTNDISQLPVAADNSADTGNGVLALQKLEIKQDETATNLNQIPDFPESNAIGNQPDTCSTINQTDCGTGSEPAAKNLVDKSAEACSTINQTDCGEGQEPAAKNLVDNDPKCQNQLNCNHVLAQNPPSLPATCLRRRLSQIQIAIDFCNPSRSLPQNLPKYRQQYRPNPPRQFPQHCRMQQLRCRKFK
jgi:hypothetical protein